MSVGYSRTHQPRDAVVGGLGAWAACPLVFHISWRAGMQGHCEYEFHRVLGQAVAVINDTFDLHTLQCVEQNAR
jgi:hypothetical protein